MEVWTTEDAFKGLCQLEDVGEERPIERLPYPTQSADEAEADDGAQTVELDVPNSVLEEAARRGIPLDNPIKLGFLALELGGEEFMRRNSSIYNTLIAIQKERDKEAEAQAAQKASADAAALMAQDYDAQLMARVAMLFRLHVPAERYEAFLADAGLAFEDLRANCLASLISRDPEEVALSQRILSLLQEQDALQEQESPLPTIDPTRPKPCSSRSKT